MTTAALVSAFSPDFRNLYNYKGLQTSDFQKHVSLVLEKNFSGHLPNNFNVSSLINLPAAQQSPLPNYNPVNPAATKQHPPLTASNSVAVCNAAQNLKSLVREHRKLDRSVSEPVDNKAQQQRQPPNSSRYKTELCRPFEESGTCKYGDKCQFAHGYAELRTLTRHPKYKTELCRTFHSTGFCPYGPRCHFIHNSEDSKKCLLDTIGSGNNGSLSPTSTVDYDICGFSIGSAGELSPTGSISSGGGSPTSSNGFFYDDPRAVPQTAPPTMTSGGFFSDHFVPLKPLSVMSSSSHDDYLSHSSDDEAMTNLENMVNEMDLNQPEPEARKPTEPVDINRNLIRLPIFSSLSLGSSP